MEQGLPPLAAEVNGTLTDPAPSLDPVTPPATASSAIGKLAVTVLALVVFVPVGLVGALVFFVCWSVATVLCVGPCLQAYFSKRDNRLLAREKLLLTHPTLVAVPIAVGINSASSGSYTVVARVTLPSVGARSSSLSLPPVIFPGGLAATQIFMARAQDQLSAAGHVTVAFDRYGVGFSDANTTGRAPSAADVAAEMDAVMRAGLGGTSASSQWIVVGGSMGATVSQAYMALYPGRVCGFVSIDGMPHGFVQSSKKYLTSYAPVYRFFARVTWTGLPRFLVSAMSRNLEKLVGGSEFDPALIAALMARSSFWGNTFLEFSTMLSCAELAAAAWGRASTPLLTPGLLARLASIAPAHSVLVDEPNGLPRSETSLRSASELGGGWLDPAAAEAVRSELRRLAASVPADVDLDTPLTDTGAFAAGRRAGGVPAGAVAYPLLPQFAAMPVRVMSMRAYDAGDGVVGKAAYSQAQRNWAAAEHSMMALLAADGARTVYPCLTHTGGFAQTSEIVAAVREVVVAAALLRGRDALPAS